MEEIDFKNRSSHVLTQYTVTELKEELTKRGQIPLPEDTTADEYNVVCSHCGTNTKVPFKPTKTWPVYCRECFEKKRKGEF